MSIYPDMNDVKVKKKKKKYDKQVGLYTRLFKLKVFK